MNNKQTTARARPRQLLILAALLVVAAPYFFYALNSGITITNDGSHFALLDSLLRNGSPQLLQPRQFAFGDSALYEGRYYSDRNPGLAFLTYAVVQLLEPIATWFQPLRLDPLMGPRYDQAQRQLIPVVMLVPAFAASALLIAMTALSRNFGARLPAALLAALMLLSGTLLLRYATLFYSHIVAASLLTWSVTALIRFARGGRDCLLWFAALLFSFAVLVEHLLLVTLLPLATYLLTRSARRILAPATLLPTLLAGALPMGMLGIYNVVCFDSPFSLAHFHHSVDTANHKLGTLFNFERLGTVLGNFLFGASKAEVGKQDLTGLIVTSPFLLACLLPLFSGKLRERGVRGEAATLAACILLVVVGAAGVFAPYGGWDRDYRYFVAILPLCAPLLALAVDTLLDLRRKRFGGACCVVGLALLGAAWAYAAHFQFGHVRHAMQAPFPTPWINLRPALVNVSLAWLYLGACALLLFGLWRLWRRREARVAASQGN